MKFEDRVMKFGDFHAKEIKGVRRFNGKSIEECALEYGVPVETWESFETPGTEMTIGEHDELIAFVYGLENRQFDTRPEEEKMTESAFASKFGQTVWACVHLGLELIYDEMREDLIQMFGSNDSQIRITELDETRSATYFPEQFLDDIDIPTLVKLYQMNESLQKLILLPHLERLHTVAEEILMVQAAQLGSELLIHDPFDEQPLYFNSEEAADFGWLFDDYLEDEDLMTFLYSNLIVGPNHPYHIDHWFDEQFWVKDDAGLPDPLSLLDYEIGEPVSEPEESAGDEYDFLSEYSPLDFIAYDSLFNFGDEDLAEDQHDERKISDDLGSDDLPF